MCDWCIKCVCVIEYNTMRFLPEMPCTPGHPMDVGTYVRGENERNNAYSRITCNRTSLGKW